MAEIVWTEEAERWLRDIHDYIALDNSVAATKVIRASLKNLRGYAASRRLVISTAMSLRAKSEFCFTGIIV